MHHVKDRNPLAGVKARNVREHMEAVQAFEHQMRHTSGAVGRPPGQRLSFWLGQAAREIREDAGVRPEQIALAFGRGKEMVDRFERGQTRPQDLEGLLAVYAKVVGLDDARDIPVRALRMWYEHGEAPSEELTDSETASSEGVPVSLPPEPDRQPDAPSDDEQQTRREE